MKKTLLTLVLTMAAIAGAMAQSITSATISYTFNGKADRMTLPASDFSTLDLSGTVAENFKIDSITVQTNGTINDLKILVADYKSGDDPEKIDENPLSQRGDTWYLMLGDDEGWIVEDNSKSTATRYFSFYFVANEDDDNPVVYNNGGSYYSIRYKTEGKGGGGGEGGGGQSGNITFYDKNTATLSLGMTGGWSSDITYTYAGDGSRDISDQPGGVNSLEISGFTLRLQRASADLEIESVSLQYKVYEEGSDGQWNTLNYDFQEDEGGNILAKKYTGTTSTQDLTKGLKQGTTYVLEVMYQVVDKNGYYYFFPSGGNDLYRFSVNNSGGGGEGGETGGSITFYDKNTATLSLGMTGVWPSDITYTYAGDGSRDISDQPGGVNSLEISGFTLRLQRASADLEIESVSLQYKVYEEGSDGQWNTLNYDFQEDEGGNILAKKYTGTTSTQDLTKGLKQGPTCILEVKYQIIDKNGNYYFFPSGGNDLYKFSVNSGGGGGEGGESVRGDLNGDGEVNMQDVMFLVNKIVNGKFPDE